MQLNINIHETVTGDLFVKELAYEQGAYADPSAELFPLSSPRFTQSASVTVLTRHTSSSSEIVKAFVHDHHITEVSNKFPIQHDGWYEVTHLVIPNESWLDEAKEKDALDNFTAIYICKDNQVWQFSEGRLVLTDITDILDSESLADSNIWMIRKNVFVLFNLWQCYLNYCKKILEGECSQDTSCPDCSDEFTKNRNLIWIFLNAIRYLVKFGEMARAQELLEEITGGCNTLCQSEMFMKQYNCGCGK